MALVDPVDRETVFFGVLRERVRPVEVLRPTDDDVRRRLREADALISEWLDEAEEEGAAILERARAEAARVRLEAAREAAELLAGVRSVSAGLAPVVALPAPSPEPMPVEVVVTARPRRRFRLRRRG